MGIENYNAPIYIRFEQDYFRKNDVLINTNGEKFKILKRLCTKWYKKLLNFISFGLYENPIVYKVEIVKDGKSI